MHSVREREREREKKRERRHALSIHYKLRGNTRPKLA